MNRKGPDTDRTPARRQAGREEEREGGEDERRDGGHGGRERKGEFIVIVMHCQIPNSSPPGLTSCQSVLMLISDMNINMK